MSIWFRDYKVEELRARAKGSMTEHLGIELIEIGEDYLRGRMPVDERTRQPGGYLHGGASITLAETLGSVGAYLCVDPQKQQVFGMAINANHIRPVREGYVEGIARPVHRGNNTQIWEIKIYDSQERLICVSRITLAVVKLRGVT